MKHDGYDETARSRPVSRPVADIPEPVAPKATAGGVASRKPSQADIIAVLDMLDACATANLHGRGRKLMREALTQARADLVR